MDYEWNLVARALGPPTNYSRQHETHIIKNLRNIVDSIFRAQGTEAKLASVAACLSGLGQASARERVYKQLKAVIPDTNILVESDARAALEGAFAGQDGIIIIAGTGSIAFGKYRSDEVLRCGGWGYLIGDEGSGFDIGRSAINAALKATDGRGPVTALLQRLCNFFKVKELQHAMPRIYAEFANRGALAKFAPMVFKEAAAGDAVALQILHEAGEALAQLGIALARRVQFEKPIPIALMGSLVVEQSELLRTVHDTLMRSGMPFVVQKPLFPADIGAAMLALKRAGVSLQQNALERLKKQLETQDHLT